MNNKKPDGKKLLRTLIELLADQEGVKIEYEIVSVSDEKRKDEKKNETDAKELLHKRSK